MSVHVGKQSSRVQGTGRGRDHRYRLPHVRTQGRPGVHARAVLEFERGVIGIDDLDHARFLVRDCSVSRHGHSFNTSFGGLIRWIKRSAGNPGLMMLDGSCLMDKGPREGDPWFSRGSPCSCPVYSPAAAPAAARAAAPAEATAWSFSTVLPLTPTAPM